MPNIRADNAHAADGAGQGVPLRRHTRFLPSREYCRSGNRPHPNPPPQAGRDKVSDGLKGRLKTKIAVIPAQAGILSAIRQRLEKQGIASAPPRFPPARE
ncbi:hypothetical protein [Neisseria bacilliformis]|uniref:hypothetical protein n=1 Tax=Neisseria bacilliformis TaxID=267212 RepID=UPI0028ECDC83|nr:hypothetical protein [Neisseria bacilliformis]